MDLNDELFYGLLLALGGFLFSMILTDAIPDRKKSLRSLNCIRFITMKTHLII